MQLGLIPRYCFSTNKRIGSGLCPFLFQSRQRHQHHCPLSQEFTILVNSPCFCCDILKGLGRDPISREFDRILFVVSSCFCSQLPSCLIMSNASDLLKSISSNISRYHLKKTHDNESKLRPCKREYTVHPNDDTIRFTMRFTMDTTFPFDPDQPQRVSSDLFLNGPYHEKSTFIICKRSSEIMKNIIHPPNFMKNISFQSRAPSQRFD